MSITELSDILNGYFSWNKSRIECFATILISLIKVRTVNLTEIACGFSSPAKQDSRYTRIKRFFREFKIDFSSVSVWVILRIKNNVITTNSRGLEVSIDALFYDLKSGEQRILQGLRKLWRQKIYLSALRLADGELLIVATDHLMDEPIEHYALRWEIETLFSCLKGRGFNFEDTHMTQPDRIEKLLVLLTIAFCWAHKTGEWRHVQKAIKIKKHGRKGVSFFRYGLDLLRDAALNGCQFIRHSFSDILGFLCISRVICAAE
ncbi:transposase [Legionella pneumophila serogroup 1]